MEINVDQMLADQAKEELEELKQQAKEAGYTSESRGALWTRLREWIVHPMFAQYPGMLRCTVLNQLQFSLSFQELNDEAWGLIGELAARWDRDSLGGLMDSLRIASLECVAEPPEEPENLRKMFKLAANPHTRWAVFAAYENVPWRLRHHAYTYSEGLVTDDDCDQWLSDKHWDDEILMSRTRIIPQKVKSMFDPP